MYILDESIVGRFFKPPFESSATNVQESGEVLLRQVRRSQLPGEIITTIQLTEVSCGTELRILQENLPDVIPAEMCYLGWQDSLEKLKKLVEPEIPD